MFATTLKSLEGFDLQVVRGSVAGGFSPSDAPESADREAQHECHKTSCCRIFVR